MTPVLLEESGLHLSVGFDGVTTSHAYNFDKQYADSQATQCRVDWIIRTSKRLLLVEVKNFAKSEQAKPKHRHPSHKLSKQESMLNLVRKARESLILFANEVSSSSSDPIKSLPVPFVFLIHYDSKYEDGVFLLNLKSQCEKWVPVGLSIPGFHIDQIFVENVPSFQRRFSPHGLTLTAPPAP